MARHPAGLRQEFASGQENGGFCDSPGRAGSTVHSGCPSEWEAQRSYGMEDLGREGLKLDTGDVERR